MSWSPFLEPASESEGRVGVKHGVAGGVEHDSGTFRAQVNRERRSINLEKLEGERERE